MIKTKKIALYFSNWNEEQLNKIRVAAPGFALIDLSGRYSVKDIADCEIFFGHMTPELIQAAKNIKWLHTQSAGVDFYMKPETGLPESVTVTNSSGAFGIGISEHLIAVTLMLMRRMGEYGRLQVQGRWNRLGIIRSVYQSLITVVGLGDIGSQYAVRCRALGASVRGVVRKPREAMPDCVDELFTIDKLDEAIDSADVTALCLPETAGTSHLFDESRMRRMKKGSIILNIGRGSAIDQEALITLLEEGHLGGAGLDVMTPEPLPPDSKLWQMHNVVLTPHISGGETLQLTKDLIVEKFARYLKDCLSGRPFERVVDRKQGY